MCNPPRWSLQILNLKNTYIVQNHITTTWIIEWLLKQLSLLIQDKSKTQTSNLELLNIQIIIYTLQLLVSQILHWNDTLTTNLRNLPRRPQILNL
jgi:hypothetical protein